MSDFFRPDSGLSGEQPAPSKQHDPSRIDHTVFTRAQCDVAWKVFSDCKLWPGFSESYGSKVRWQGTPWNAGSRLQFEIMGPELARVECVITLCAAPQCIAWINYFGGHTMQQCVLFEPCLGGGTKITTWIEIGNPMNDDSRQVRLLLKSLLETWFGNFTAECDHQARVSASERRGR